MQSLLLRDISLRAITKCGRFRVTAVSGRDTLLATLQRHPHLLDVAPAGDSWDPAVGVPLLGHVINFTNCAASWLDHEERVHTQFFTPKGSGCTASLICESLALGESRSFVSLDGPDSSNADFAGVLKVQRIIYKQTQPVLSATKCPLPPNDDFDGRGADNLRDPREKSLIPHASFFFAQSDGVPTAAFFFTGFDPKTQQEQQLRIPYSAGILLQPVASSAIADEENPVEQFVEHRRQLFDRLAEYSPSEYWNLKEQANDSSTTSSIGSRLCLLASLHERARHGFLLHDLLGIMTGDWDGAARCCSKARHFHPGGSTATTESMEAAKRIDLEDLSLHVLTPPPNSAASKIGNKIELDPESVQRVALDFFCRCSKSNDFLKYLKSLGSVEKALELFGGDADDESLQYTCTYCSQAYTISRDDVRKLFEPEAKS